MSQRMLQIDLEEVSKLIADLPLDERRKINMLLDDAGIKLIQAQERLIKFGIRPGQYTPLVNSEFPTLFSQVYAVEKLFKVHQ